MPAMRLIRRGVPHDRDLLVGDLPAALGRRLLGPLDALRQERQRHPPDPGDGGKDSIHDDIRPARPGELQPEPAVDGPQRDYRDPPPDVRVRHERPSPGPLEPQVVQRSRERLQRQPAHGDEPDARVVAPHVLVAVGHPDAHGHYGERDAEGEDLPGGVQPHGDAAREDADEDGAHGEEEREGEAAQDAVRGLDVGLEALGLEEVLAGVPVLLQGVVGVV